MSDQFDPYSVLDLSRNCTEEEINTAYKTKSRIHHPDKPGGDPVKFGQCTKAKNLLLDRQKRNMYDRGGWNAVKQHEQMQQMQTSRNMKCEPINLKLRVSLEQVYRHDTINIKETLPENSGEFQLDLKLDPGMIGHGICVENKGICREDYITGDVIIHVELDSSRTPFQVQGLNLVLECKMQLADLLGFTLQIEHPSGTTYSIKTRYDPDRQGNMVMHYPKLGLTGGDDTGDMIVVITPDLSGLTKLPKKIIGELQTILEDYRKYASTSSKSIDITEKSQPPPRRSMMPGGIQMMGSINGMPIPMPMQMDGDPRGCPVS